MRHVTKPGHELDLVSRLELMANVVPAKIMAINNGYREVAELSIETVADNDCCWEMAETMIRDGSGNKGI